MFKDVLWWHNILTIYLTILQLCKHMYLSHYHIDVLDLKQLYYSKKKKFRKIWENELFDILLNAD